MDRRTFVGKAGLAGVVSVSGLATASGASSDGRDLFELRSYEIETESQSQGLANFMQEAAIPALSRLDLGPVGVFAPAEGLSPVWVLLRHKSLESVLSLTRRLLADQEFQKKGAEFLDAPASSPAYVRVQSSLLQAFSGMPRLETPIQDAGRVFQLRIYESPSLKTGQKKIEMFNKGEIDIFRKTGLHPVFFGEAIVGSHLPNLTYMLVFRNAEERDANWKQFVSHPDWKELSSKPEYADKKILSDITNIHLMPTDCSQI